MIKKTLAILAAVVTCCTVRAEMFSGTADRLLTKADFNCFTIIAGRGATADGSVMVAHNEDDGGQQMLNMYVMPAGEWNPQRDMPLEKGGRLGFDRPSARYIWMELPGMDVSDGYLNEYGVAVVSNGCPSREDRQDYTDGGIVYGIRTAAAAKARTAREAVQIIGALVERYGYASSGRSYTVADSRQAWIVSVVQGRQWAAARIPDDHVMLIPNYYVMNDVDLGDTANYLGNSKVTEYAIERGWYDPARDGKFNFARAYSNTWSYVHPDNVSREWSALCKLSGRDYKREDHESFPFSFVPNHPVTVSRLGRILSDHYEGTDLSGIRRNEQGNPHGAGVGGTICAGSTQFSAIYQLRDDRPADIGAVVWVAPFHACSQIFVPWYAGLQSAPRAVGRFATASEAFEKHFTDAENFRERYPAHPYWSYVDLVTAIEVDYPRLILPVQQANQRLQTTIFDRQARFEKNMMRLYRRSPQALPGALLEYTSRWMTLPQMSTPTPATPKL